MRKFVTALIAAASLFAALTSMPTLGDDPTKPIPWSCAPEACGSTTAL